MSFVSKKKAPAGTYRLTPFFFICFLCLGTCLFCENYGSGQSEGYTALVEIRLEVPVRFLGNLLPAASMTLHTEAKYVPLF